MIDLGVALYHGEFAAVSALMEHHGIPIDMENFRTSPTRTSGARCVMPWCRQSTRDIAFTSATPRVTGRSIWSVSSRTLSAKA